MAVCLAFFSWASGLFTGLAVVGNTTGMLLRKSVGTDILFSLGLALNYGITGSVSL